MRLFGGDPNKKDAITIHLLPDVREWVWQQARGYDIPETLVIESLVISAQEGQDWQDGLAQFSKIHREHQREAQRLKEEQRWWMAMREDL